MNRGYNCCACDHWNPFPPYVFAHWDEDLVTRCEECRHPHTINSGRVIDNGTAEEPPHD